MGDLLINRGLLEIISEGGELHLDTKGVPKFYESLILHNLKKSNVTLYNSNKFFLSLLFSRGDKVLFLKPGGYMGVNSWKMGLRRLLQAILLNFAKFNGVRIIRSPSSQQNSTGLYRIIDRLRMRAMSIQFIRDEISCLAINEMGFEAISSYDLATYFFSIESHELFPKHFDSSSSSKNQVLISLRKPRSAEDVNLYSAICSKIQEQNAKINFISQVFYDDEINKRFASDLNVSHESFQGNLNSLKNVINEYQKSVFVVSNRLHVLLLALMSGAIPIALVTKDDAKVTGYLQTIGLENNIVQLDKPDTLNLKLLQEGWSVESAQKTSEQGRLLKKQILDSLT